MGRDDAQTVKGGALPGRTVRTTALSREMEALRRELEADSAPTTKLAPITRPVLFAVLERHGTAIIDAIEDLAAERTRPWTWLALGGAIGVDVCLFIQAVFGWL